MYPNNLNYESLIFNPDVYVNRNHVNELTNVKDLHNLSSTSAIVKNVHEHGCCGMSMFFHAGINEPYVLFKEWQIHSVGELVWSSFAVFFMALLYEGLKTFRQYISAKYAENSNECCMEPGHKTFYKKFIVVPKLSGHVFQTILHMIQLVISYFLMLIAMTYNVWLCLALVLGAGVGYFIFGFFQKPDSENNNEHCH